MDVFTAVVSLGALAQETRLEIFRLLVKAGSDGLPAGRIGARLELPPATLSFHLNQLRHAGLVNYRREGRSLLYAAEYAAMNSLVDYLTENCCQGGGTCDVAAPAPRLARTSKGVRSHETPARARRR
jgi:ArsR family transcriptional regulator